ncbi:MAG TPA: Mov34/MPN/PAD-1 family protein [Kofleriaceae bacterium]|nr:Mov34/MPN/PAD-1 family protein [Kofleriaceae bacterium]
MSSLDVRAIDDADLKKEKAPAVSKYEYRVFLAEEAFDRAVERGTADTSREIGGVLVGELLKDDAGPYLKIETTIDALHADEKGAELTFTHATWDHINKEMDTKHKGKKVVGWYHTHPGFGVFLSDRDQFIQKSFFNLPFQVAFVYDPKTREHGMFTWRDNEVHRTRRYFVGSREHIWDANRTTGEPTKKDVERPASETAKAAPEPLLGEGPGAMATIVIIGLILLLIGGFLGRWWGASGANQALMQAQIDISRAKAEGAAIQMSQLQSELVGVLRATIGDETVRKPVAQAIADLDSALKELDAAPAAAGSGAAPPPVSPEERLKKAKNVIAQLRQNLMSLSQDRFSAQAALAQLEMLSKRNSMIRADLEHDVAQQRTALGQMYAELASDVLKTGDKNRAKRLLTTAAQVDPGNTSRYEAQLQTFEKGATLPRDNNGESADGPADGTTPSAPTSPTPATNPAAPGAAGGTNPSAGSAAAAAPGGVQ